VRATDAPERRTRSGIQTSGLIVSFIGRRRPLVNPDRACRGPKGFSTILNVGIIALVFLTCAVLLVVGAEWPRLAARFGGEGRAARSRRRRKAELTLISGEEGDQEDFAASVERDLANLPVIDAPDDRSSRR
jgi:hypothetical protein